ncbi:hypothetical protein [Arenivirga flava]|uniref:Alpha/beta hydrolase n=1 Tax=Arenivirga flava TaxID=1930060 RepID=A0AA37XAM4_9MICO|nr:hypothetical protein [Arenivirga flava]GMA26822.1 hypothetical protein GCM10025874_00750 [Arenivirga flava]GMA29933.1 hypothetical protein GCM10025874_31860 [Arenivirga flava]
MGEPQQTALVLGAAGAIGALGGIPPLARAAANRVNATRALTTIDEEIRSAEESRPSGALREEVFADHLEKLRDERTYVAKVAEGSVQLYLWDRDRGHIVEMVGDFTKEYHRVITYTPGTFTNMQSFYDGSVQEAAKWFTGENSGAVGFVWKGAEFPGQTRELGKPVDTFVGINEANAQQLALDTGSALAAFQDGIRADPRIDGSQSIAMGHSWGLAATTGSEVAGAHYDQVHSLAGAWMPQGWDADGDTGYHHWSYTDFLSVAQDFGLVGEGNVPDTDPAFTSTIYESDEDSTIYIPTTTNPWAPTPPGEIRSASGAGLTENHTLIATQEDKNLEALLDMRARMDR